MIKIDRDEPRASQDLTIATLLDAEMPGFWDFFAARHPEFGPATPAGPLGYQAAPVYEAIGDSITAYVLAHRSLPADVSPSLSAPLDTNLAYAQRLAAAAAAHYGPPPGWRALDDMYGVLMQIDNALTGLCLRPEETK